MLRKSFMSSTELLNRVSENLSTSIELKDFFPKTLQAIKSYLNCEQVFISYLNSEGEEEIIANESDNNTNHFQQIAKNYFTDENKLRTFQENKYYSSNNLSTDDITEPLLKSELIFPIVIKNPQINSFLLQNLWGVLFIYDYDNSRKWKKREINTINLVVKQIILAVERNIIYEQLELKNKQIKAVEIFDNLTKLPNYNSFRDCLEFEWFRLVREKEPLSLIMIAINIPNSEQKQVILPKIANLFLEIPSRISDLPARYADSKFTVILPQTNQNGANVVANKLANLIKNQLLNYDNITFNVSVISCIPRRELDYNILVTTAENAITEAIENKVIINVKEIS